MDHIKPNYKDGSIVNLVSSILKAYGKKNMYAPLKGLDVKELKKAKNIVLFVIDGLGTHTLHKKGKGTIFYNHHVQDMTSIFPSTTANAMTAFATGVTAQQHGFMGWHTNVLELGGIATLLPFIPRIGGINYGMLGVNPMKFFKYKSIFEQIKVKSYEVTPEEFIDREYYFMTKKKCKSTGYVDMESMFTSMKEVLSKRGKKFIHTYWPDVDTIAHEKGVSSKLIDKHLKELDKHMRKLLKRSKDTIFLITADHGLINTPAKKRINLNNIKGFHDCLAVAQSGEGRASYFFVRPGKVKDFKAIWKKHLSKQTDLFPTSKLIKQNYFGLGKPSPEFLRRVGDYMIIPKEDYLIKDFLQGQRPHWLVANHGGLTKEEMIVPLIKINT